MCDTIIRVRAAEDVASRDGTGAGEREVEEKVNDIIGAFSADKYQYRDPDFGPRPEDPHGSRSLFGATGEPPAGYFDASVVRWDRPMYGSAEDGDADDIMGKMELEDEFSEEATRERHAQFCTHGELYKDGANACDVVQGKLGDCWFLGALSVLATRQDLLAKVRIVRIRIREAAAAFRIDYEWRRRRRGKKTNDQ